MKGYHLNKAKLTIKQRDAILNELEPRTSAHKIFSYLATAPTATTTAIKGATGVQNIARTASLISGRLLTHGLVVACERLEHPIDSETLNAHTWGIYEREPKAKGAEL